MKELFSLLIAQLKADISGVGHKSSRYQREGVWSSYEAFTTLNAVGISPPVCSSFWQVNFWSLTGMWLLQAMWVIWSLGEARLGTTKPCCCAGGSSVRDAKAVLTEPTDGCRGCLPCSCSSCLQPASAGRLVGWCSHLMKADWLREARCRNVVTCGWGWRGALLEHVSSARLWLWLGWGQSLQVESCFALALPSHPLRGVQDDFMVFVQNGLHLIPKSTDI